MYLDPTGHFWFTIICALISCAVSVTIEFAEDINDGELFNDKDVFDYLGAAVGGFISGLGGGLVSSLALGIAGDVVDAWISGGLKEIGVGELILTSAISSAIGFGVGKVVGKGMRKVATFAKAKQFFNMKGIVSNNVINKQMKPIANGLNIGSKKATISKISQEIFRANKWTTGRYIEDIVMSIF